MGWRHLLEDIQKSFWAVRVGFGYSFRVWGGPPPPSPLSLTMNPGQMGRATMKLRACCRLQQGGVVGQAMLADWWIGGQKSGLQKETPRRKRCGGERLERRTKGVRGKAFFERGRRRISQVWLSLTLSYLIF